MDETCVLCEKCFNYDVHKNHNFWYTIGKDNCGSCDCGEEDSWKSDLRCCIHSTPASAPFALKSNLYLDSESHLKSQIEPLLNFIIKSLNDYRLSRGATNGGENCILILYNDEKHSFHDVIEILTSEIGVNEDIAFKIASNVNEYVMLYLCMNILFLGR